MGTTVSLSTRFGGEGWGEGGNATASGAMNTPRPPLSPNSGRRGEDLATSNPIALPPESPKLDPSRSFGYPARPSVPFV